MERRPITLYAFVISPFVQKVAALLDYKQLPYRPVFIHPQRKAEIAFSTKKLVPIIDDGGTIVEDSTDIALYLEEHYPTPGAPCTLCADGSAACPISFCDRGRGQCRLAFQTCPAASCGGFAGLACPEGQECIDDSRDACDPTVGGIDCSGVCVL